MKRALTLFAAFAVAMAPTLGVFAQTEETVPPPAEELTVVTPYPAVAVEPGDQVGFDLTVSAPTSTEVELTAEGVPEGWNASFRGGGFELDSVMAGPGAPATVEFSVTVPADAGEGTVAMTIGAEGGGDTVSLPLRVRISAAAGGEVTLSPDFPGLRAPSGETVTFDVTLRNDTPADYQFELDASGPAAWQVSAEPAGEAQAATLGVEAGAEETIRVEATSPGQAEAGQYPITLQARAGDTEVSTELIVEIVGSFSLDLTTTEQRLNADVTVGSSSDLGLLVTNTGTASLTGIALSATPPSGWEVTFDSPELAQVAPGESAVVTATITPSDEAVAGDYIISFSAQGEQTDDQIEVRTTVTPSAVWGLLGVGLIALTLAGLAVVFRRFGRR